MREIRKLPEPSPSVEYNMYGASKVDKFFYWGLGLFFVAFLIYVPFMVRDNNRYLDNQWKTQGCQMYDDYDINNVPAKCQTFFIDHYQSQQTRLQPPDAK